MTHSLTLAGGFELLAGGQQSVSPAFSGATFRLADPFDFGGPVPSPELVANMILDGSRSTGRRADNRTIVLPVTIIATDPVSLDAGRESLLHAVDAERWYMVWTRDLGAFGQGLPMVFDCQRSKSAVVAWSIRDADELLSHVTLTFDAYPYARSDVPEILDFPSPLAGINPPPPQQLIDGFTAVSGTQWSLSSVGPGGSSAHWSPAGTGAGSAPLYAATPGLGPFNLSLGGYAQANQGGGNGWMTLYDGQFGGDPVRAGDTFQIGGNFLTGQNTGFEGGIGTWTGPNFGNTNTSGTSAQAHSGSSSLQLSSVAAGDIGAQHCNPVNYATQGMAVLPNDLVTAVGWFRAATVARQCSIGIEWYDAFGNLLSTSYGAVLFGSSSIADTTTGWTQATAQAVAPAGAAWAIAAGKAAATGGAAEVHYMDDVQLFGRGSPPVTPQVYTVTSIGAPALGYVNANFTPPTTPALNTMMLKVGPPSLSGLEMLAAFGSTRYYTHWCRGGGQVTFHFSLTDSSAMTIKFSKVVHKVKGSSSAQNPLWMRVQVPIPFVAGFNYRSVASYTVKATNRATDLIYTDFYIDNLTATPPPINGPAATRGQVVRFAGIKGTARAPANWQLQQQGAATNVQKTYIYPGTYMWTCPALVTQVAYYGLGGGGDSPVGVQANGSAGGSGAGSAAKAVCPVTPGKQYKVVVGAAGIVGIAGANPVAPQASSFTDDFATTTAPAGVNATSASAPAGGAAGPGGFAGGAGGAGGAGISGGGGAGGGSAGNAANGNPGGAASGGTGGTPGAAVAGGWAGGRGGTFGTGNGQTPAGFGTGAGGSPARSFGTAPIAKGGFVQLTYLQPPIAKTLIVHRPSFDAPDTLCPFVSPNVADVPDGTTEYAIPTMLPGLPARFGGTYTVVAINWSWNGPTTSRTVSATINQYDQSGAVANAYPTPGKTFTPSTDPDISKNGIVILGEVTLPGRRLAPENLAATYGLTLTSSNTGDRFMDVLLLDTQGSTVIINSSVGYANFYLDEPLGEDIGLIMGSFADREGAVSVTDQCMIISGPPPGVDPDGCQTLLLYAVEGAPGAHIEYYSRWRSARFA